ncbi:MAG: ATP-dependent 6-phosphofructokinase [candidate division KSB1 bacterium]|nr:ATP-dependent 6-phosphofructokinase [candidate division KSB1 bacterium]
MADFQLKRVGILTGGGDCPGLNAVIRAVAKAAMGKYDATVIGIEDGFEGFVEGRMHEIQNKEVSGILSVGGTILGTSNKGDPFHYPIEDLDGNIQIVDESARVIRNYRHWGLDALIAIGGDGTMHISQKLFEMGLNIIGVPKTIDNDLAATDLTFGYDSALFVATEAIDRLHTTASSHHRVMVIEVMGRYAGWIALGAGLAGGADIILIPEIPFRWESIYKKVRERSLHGKRFSIVCVAEGARPEDGDIVVKAHDIRRTDAKQLGGIGELVGQKISEDTGLETRVTVLGHLQRGGSPTAFDRNLATKYGAAAIDLAAEGQFGRMVALRGQQIISVPIKEAIAQQRLVPLDCPEIRAARAVGTSFGDD